MLLALSQCIRPDMTDENTTFRNIFLGAFEQLIVVAAGSC